MLNPSESLSKGSWDARHRKAKQLAVGSEARAQTRQEAGPGGSEARICKERGVDTWGTEEARSVSIASGTCGQSKYYSRVTKMPE